MSVASIKADAKKASYNPLTQTLARLGYGARGLIYIMIGFLALDIAPGYYQTAP